MFNITRSDLKEVPQDKTGLLAAGGVIGALAAASCCIVPLFLTLLGVSGAWMSNLRALAPYQPYFIAIATAAIAYGFYLVYWKPQPVCIDGTVCARPIPNRLVKMSLWTGAVIVLAALTFRYWFSIILPYLP